MPFVVPHCKRQKRATQFRFSVRIHEAQATADINWRNTGVVNEVSNCNFQARKGVVAVFADFSFEPTPKHGTWEIILQYEKGLSQFFQFVFAALPGCMSNIILDHGVQDKFGLQFKEISGVYFCGNFATWIWLSRKAFAGRLLPRPV